MIWYKSWLVWPDWCVTSLFFPADPLLLQTGVNIREKKRQKSLMWNDCSIFGKKKKNYVIMHDPTSWEPLNLVSHLLYWSTSTFYCCVHIKTWKSMWNKWIILQYRDIVLTCFYGSPVWTKQTLALKRVFHIFHTFAGSVGGFFVTRCPLNHTNWTFKTQTTYITRYLKAIWRIKVCLQV